METGLGTASILFLIIAAQSYGRMLAFSGLPAGFGALVSGSGMGPAAVIALHYAVVIAMGMILDGSSITLILVPIVLPVVNGFGMDLVRFGTVTVEIGLLTPSFGISDYVIEATLDDPSVSLGDIFAGTAPFALAMPGVRVLVVLFPVIATGLVP